MTWEDAWREGRTGWDAGTAAPSLVQLVERGELDPVERTLVPGCGAGYDAMVLAQVSAQVVGLDLAPTAATRFAEVRAGAGKTDAEVRIEIGDFFAFEPEVPFDRAWDYTFLCAIPMERREDWAAHMTRLIRPGGELLTLIFPQKWVRGDGDRSSPPFRLMPDEVMALLAPTFDQVSLDPVPESQSHPGRAGLESLARWRRRP